MPEIGATLREARMRARIDISEIESETKIRAKYLRALENEEWDLLPGPTYVKSFLRTYANALGLDARLLLEEYKLRHERPSAQDLLPIAPPRSRPGRGRGPRLLPRVLLVVVLLVAVLAVLWLLGRGGDDDGPRAGATTPTATATTPARTTTTPRRRTTRRAATPKYVRLRVEATGPVFVCLVAAGGRRPINGVNLQPGSTQEFRSSRFRLTLGNGNARLRIDGRVRDVPDVADGIGYEVRRGGKVQRLSARQRPSCARA